MKTNYCLHIFLIALALLVSCNKKDDDHANPNEGGDEGQTVFIYDLPYTLNVQSPEFTAEDVAKPLAMTITGKNVSGTLTLQNADGTFSGTLQMPSNVPDSLLLTATIEIPAAGGETDDYSTVSLADVMSKCGHKYVGTFEYRSEGGVALKDSKAYFEFRMSPCQHWMKINSQKYPVNSDGKVWIAVDEKTSIVTTFYRQAYETVEGGSVYTVDREGFVDFGITNMLWADRNVGAEHIWDFGEYYDWDEAQESITLPKELPVGGEKDDDENDFELLFANTEQQWGKYNGVTGCYFFMPDYTDKSKDPFIFLPAGGAMSGDHHISNDCCLYWSSKEYDADNAYRLFVRQGLTQTDNHISKSSIGSMSVRPIRHGNNYNDEGKYDQELKPLAAFFPTGYDASSVVAWYTCKNETRKDVWALYLFDDNKYIVTRHQVQKEERIINNAGVYEIVGEDDNSYNNFTIKATLGSEEKNIVFSDGECTLLNKQFTKEDGALPEATDYTQSNINVRAIYFPATQSVNQVAAWYKEMGANDKSYRVFYLFNDNTYSVCFNQIKDGMQQGSEMAAGTYWATDGNYDYQNMNMEISARQDGQDYTIPLPIKNGQVTMLMITMELQELSLLHELLGE